MKRFKKEWYDKRIKQNRNIKNHLIEIINENKDANFAWKPEELFCLNYEDLLEIAVAVINVDCTIVLGAGKDWDCGRDGKVSIVRLHNYGKHYTAGIVGCKNKTHIVAMVYECIQEKFYYFNFPVAMDEHSIPFNVETGEPIRTTSRGPNKMWDQYECTSFKQMVLENNH